MIRRGAALLAAAAVVLGVPAAAQAERWSGTDARRDVIDLTWDPQPEPCGTVTTRARPRDATDDITGLSVLHAHDVVRVTVHLRDLRPGERFVDVALRTPRRSYLVEVARYRGFPWPALSTSTGLSVLPRHLPEAGECGTVIIGSDGGACAFPRTVFSAARILVSVDVPRRCLGTPRWVRAGATVQGSYQGVAGIDRWGSTDLRGGFMGPLGPRVRSGAQDLDQNGLPSKDSRVTNSATGLRRSFVISRTGLPIGTTAASAN